MVQVCICAILICVCVCVCVYLVYDGIVVVLRVTRVV